MDAELKETLERIENKLDGLILNQTRPKPSKDIPVTDEAKKEISEDSEAEPTAETTGS